jgi:hypothetical protein
MQAAHDQVAARAERSVSETDLPRFLTRLEVADLLRISERTSERFDG